MSRSQALAVAFFVASIAAAVAFASVRLWSSTTPDPPITLAAHAAVEVDLPTFASPGASADAGAERVSVVPRGEPPRPRAAPREPVERDPGTVASEPMEAWRWDSSFEPLVETMREFYKLEVPESAWDDPRVRELWRLVRLRDAACSRFGRYIERELDRWEFSKPSVPLIEDSIEVIEALRLEFGDSDELYRAIDEYDAAVRAAIWNGGGDTLNLDQPSSSRVTSAVNELARPAFAALMDILKEKQ